MKIRRLIYPLIMLSFLCASCCQLCNSGAVSESSVKMGTFVEIKVPSGTASSRRAASQAIRKAFAEIDRIEGVFSVYKKDSEVSRINSLPAFKKLKISPEVFALMERSLEYSRKTDGAFDITVKPLVDLWRERGRSQKAPSDAEISEALERVGYDKVVLDKATGTIAFKEDGMSIDFGGVAKGYAADRVAALFKEDGIRDALINVGGAMYCLGERAPGEAWRIGIRDPAKKGGALFEIALRDMAVNTSGGYERYYTIGGKRYSHIIDPRTGRAADGKIMSATAIAKDSADSDMAATALCVLGKGAFGLSNGKDGEAALLILNRDGRMEQEETDGFKRYR